MAKIFNIEEDKDNPVSKIKSLLAHLLSEMEENVGTESKRVFQQKDN